MKRDAPKRVLAGKYELLDVVGKGGMAVVWRAVQRGAAGFTRPVAVKRMLLDIARDADTVSLFVEEARVGSQLAHPHILQVVDFGVDEGGVYYIVLEWVDGLDFLDYMRSYHQAKRHVPWQAVAAVAIPVLDGLQAAHERIDDDGQHKPVIHRDVTPSNILLGTNGVVKLADFGLARAMDRMTQTLPNIIKGKMAYTAPELARGGKASAQSDVFALGVTLWEALAGRRLFAGNTPIEVIKSIQAWKIPSLALLRPDVPEGMVKLVERAIARDTATRFATARDMRRALAAVLRPLPDPVDATRLGVSVTAARERLRQMDAEAQADIEVVDELSSSNSIDVSVDFHSSPASKRAAQAEGRDPLDSGDMPTLPRIKTPDFAKVVLPKDTAKVVASQPPPPATSPAAAPRPAAIQRPPVAQRPPAAPRPVRTEQVRPQAEQATPPAEPRPAPRPMRSSLATSRPLVAQDEIPRTKSSPGRPKSR